jgi:hypothetical protein
MIQAVVMTGMVMASFVLAIKGLFMLVLGRDADRTITGRRARRAGATYTLPLPLFFGLFFVLQALRVNTGEGLGAWCLAGAITVLFAASLAAGRRLAAAARPPTDAVGGPGARGVSKAQAQREASQDP